MSLMTRIESIFKTSSMQTDVKTECLAGVTTFLTMAYIVFVNPAILSGQLFDMNTGIDLAALTVATCLSAAIATAFMAFYANYPIALAPGMGGNLLFIFTAWPAATAAGFANPGQTVFATVFVAAVAFLILSFLGIKELIVDAISPSMKNGIAVGIGLFIAFIGLQNAGLIAKDPGTAVKLNTSFTSPDFLVFIFGVTSIVAMYARQIRGAILWGILATTLLSVVLRFAIPLLPESVSSSPMIMESMLMQRFTVASQIFSSPPSLAPTFLKLDFKGALSWEMLPYIIIFFFLHMLGCIGTVVGVCQQGGFIRNNKLPRADRILRVDAASGVVGAVLGTTTVTSYIESAAGVQQGGKTGLASIVTAALFILAIFFSPLIAMVGSYPLITAPALVIIGAMMMSNVRQIDWDDYSEILPAFLMIIGIPLTYSIADGIMLGFIVYPIVKLSSGKRKDLSMVSYVISLLLFLYLVFFRIKA
jgi:AGZA family xanthine/uracil permease-like MFS transporter